MVPPPPPPASSATTSSSRSKRDRIVMANVVTGPATATTTGTTTSRSNHSVLSAITGSSTTGTATAAAAMEEDHPDLLELEERLNHDVDEDFLVDPRKSHTLHRVIDVLGMQLDSGTGGSGDYATSRGGGGGTEQLRGDLGSNPAYQDLKRQQQVVEEAIEHLALIQCADLNGSVVQVGRVARQFHDAATQVRLLRKQVKEIQETLGATGHGSITTNNNNNATGTANATGANTTTTATTTTTTTTVAMSLRELWLKKLCL